MLLQTAYTDNKYQLYKNGELCFEDECKLPALRWADNEVSVPDKITKSFPIFIKQSDPATGIVDAIVAVIGNIDFGDDIIHPGAFTKTINERGLSIRVLDNHNAWSIMDVIGKPLLLREIGKDELPAELLTKFPDATGGLLTSTQYLMNTKEGAGAFERIHARAIEEYSIGFQIVDQDMSTVETDEGTREVRNIREIKLFEYSPVIWAMNPATQTISSALDAELNQMAANGLVSAADLLLHKDDDEQKCASCKFYGMVTEDMGYCTLNNEAVKADNVSDGFEAIEETLGALVSEDLSSKLSEFLSEYFTMLAELDLHSSDDEFLITTVENMLALFDDELLGARLPAPKEYTIPKSKEDDEDDSKSAAAEPGAIPLTAHAAMSEETKRNLIKQIMMSQIEAHQQNNNGGNHA